MYFCKQINKLGFSYAFSYLDPANQTVIQLTNQDRDFFNPIVKQFFKITDEKQFEDKQHKTFKEWMLANFDQTELADLCNHGAQNGFHGLIYYTETSALYNQYQSDIWDALYEEYESLDYKSILELISSFNGSIQVNSDEQFKNLLVWVAAEKIAFEITEGEYPNDDECENNAEEDE